MEHTKKEIWTIGHSTRSEQEFLQLLKFFKIEMVADIRTFPGSRRYPHFNKELLSRSLMENDIRYQHLMDLGGRRKPLPDSPHTAWRHASFRGYADHMDTPAFKQAIQLLENEALQWRSAYMCSEAMWWKCHRAMVSDYLKVKGWSVYHILDINKSQLHPYTSPARSEQGNLFY
jgi:uncharacterized protein (DUF488 family)